MEDSSSWEQSPDPLSRSVSHSRLPGTSSSPTRPADTGAPSPPPPHSLAWPKTRPLQLRAGSQLCNTGFTRRKTGPWAELRAPPSGSASLSELVFALKQFRPSGKWASLKMEAALWYVSSLGGIQEACSASADSGLGQELLLG